MNKTTTVRLNLDIVKQAKIKCIQIDLSFSKYLEKLMEEDLEKDKKEKHLLVR